MAYYGSLFMHEYISLAKVFKMSLRLTQVTSYFKNVINQILRQTKNQKTEAETK